MKQNNKAQAVLSQVDSAELIEASNGQQTISIPINLKQRSGRSLITLPDGTGLDARPWDKKLTPWQTALVKGHRWRDMLENGEAKSLKDIADKENRNSSYVSRMINFTVLAPDIVEAILDDTLPPNLKLLDLAINPPRLWEEQRKRVWG